MQDAMFWMIDVFERYLQKRIFAQQSDIFGEKIEKGLLLDGCIVGKEVSLFFFSQNFLPTEGQFIFFSQRLFQDAIFVDAYDDNAEFDGDEAFVYETKLIDPRDSNLHLSVMFLHKTFPYFTRARGKVRDFFCGYLNYVLLIFFERLQDRKKAFVLEEFVADF